VDLRELSRTGSLMAPTDHLWPHAADIVLSLKDRKDQAPE